MSSISSEMLRGHIDTIILLSLIDSDKHTAQIKEEIESRADGQFELKQGTFYSCLQRIVKQGYVTEYRTTVDGVRRKFFQLTEKGKIYIDENKDKWAYSREMINVLIQAPLPQEEEQPTVKTKTVPAASETPQKPVKEDEVSPEDTLKNFLSSQLDEPAASEPTTKKPAEKTQPSQTEKREQHQPQTKSGMPEYDIFSLMDYTQSDVFFDEGERVEDPVSLAPQTDFIEPRTSQNGEPAEKPVFKVSEPQPQEKAPEKAPKLKETPAIQEPAAPQAVQTQNNPIESVVEQDDTYSPENGAKDYRTILSRLFGSEPQETKSDVREVDYTDGFDINTFLNPNDNRGERKQPAQTETKPKKPKKTDGYVEQPIENTTTTVKHPYYDFSDIQSMADAEGFKIKISSAENVKDRGRIFINKLVFHSALIFYAIILVETLVLYFTTAQAAGLNFIPYLLFLVAVGVFPSATAVIYLLNKDKKVQKVAGFKQAIELVAIIMLNLLLIIIVCAVLSNVNFADQAAVLKFLVYPLFFVINLPVYLIIKYLKLDKNKYFN